MATPILATKLYIPPPRPKAIHRHRLIERLNEGLHAKLTLISAPAGFGKTTLTSQWCASEGRRRTCAWLALDEDDNDFARFATYLIKVWQQLQPAVGESALALLQSPQPLSKSILVMLINDSLAQASEHPLALVLDDYHVIGTPAIHEAVTYLVDHLPPHMHLVITTRTEPPLPLARWRARNQLTEIRSDDLRFTIDEAAQFLEQMMGVELPANDITALEARTEGWIAGLQLVALYLQKQENKSTVIQSLSGSHRYILDYLVDEVLQRQSPPMHTFLLQTSILNRFSAPLCDAVTGRVDGQAMLKELEQTNLFVVSLDEERRWYRYHHLFADALRVRLQETWPDMPAELHRRASAWYEQNGMSTEAVNHSLLASDFPNAIRLIEPMAQHLIARGEVMTLVRWLQSLPQAEVQINAPLCIAGAMAQLIIGNFDAIEPQLEKAEQALQRSKETVDTWAKRDLLNELNAIRAIVSIEHVATPEVIELAHRTLAQLPPDKLFLRGTLSYSLGLAYSTRGETRMAKQTLSDAKAISARSNHWLTTLATSYELAELAIEQGELHRAQVLHQEAMQWIEQRSNGRGEQSLPLGGAAQIGLGKLAYEWNDLASARYLLETGIELVQSIGGLGIARHGVPALALVCHVQGEAEVARQLMQQAEELARQSPRADAVARLQPYKVRLWLAQGNVTAAWQWAEENSLNQHRPLSYPFEIDYVTRARVFLLRPTAENFARTATLLADALGVAEAHGRMGRVIEILMLQARLFAARRETERAMSILQRSLALAEAEGYVRTFVDEGDPVRVLLAKLHTQIIEPRLRAYTDRLLAAFSETTSTATVLSDRPQRHLTLVEPLTERELEVLRLLVAGLSNREIAEKLIVAEGTVKKYTNNIYGKLGVQRRSQAIARAALLELV